MRRNDRETSQTQTEDVLARGEYGTLSTVCEDGSPYAVAVNYVWWNSHLYFHCAIDGHKLSNIRRDERVCFTVVTDTAMQPEKLTTAYKSAVVFGIAKEVYGQEKNTALMKLVEKYAPGSNDAGRQCIAQSGDVTTVVCITPLCITGKAKE
jgi:nitroimidazol reductase NimA-like FMN-containing flavoprotein (pyridoxamine 5'-phosphate oxidase superfamily)